MQNQHSIAVAVIVVIIAIIVILPTPAISQILPFVADEIVTEDIKSESSDTDSGAALQRICTFKLSNPDTLPFYLLVSFKEGGMLVHTSRERGLASMRLVDLELRYNNDLSMPIVKVFPGSEFDENVPVRRRAGGSWVNGGGQSARFGKKKVRPENGENAGNRGYRTWVYEIPFLPEDAQVSYEMEVWGALRVRDGDGRVVAGRYMETISLDIEAMGESNERVRDGVFKRRRK